MAETNRPPEPDQEPKDSAAPADEAVHAEVRYDEPGIPVIRVILLLVAIAITFGATALAAYWILQIGSRTPPSRNEAASDYGKPTEEFPPNPRLELLNEEQGDQSHMGISMRLQLEQYLHEYGRSMEEGFVCIPIEKAIQFAAEQLPTRQNMPDHSKSHGLLGGGEANSGRIFQERPSWYQHVE